jgi:23S rRNA G2445 N2-methylase RlmL
MLENNNTINAYIENLKNSNDKQRISIINNLSLDYKNSIPVFWSKALNEENPRMLLSVIRDIIRKEKPKALFTNTIGFSKEKLSDFLSHSDAKTRKNVCGIIGELGDPAYLEALYLAYMSEDQQFVRASYASAIGSCGGALDGEKLNKILEDLLSKENTSADTNSPIKINKHINEEKLALTKAIDKLSPLVSHKFKGFENPVPMLLTLMNNQYHLALNDLKEKSIKGQLIEEGILIKEKDLDKVYSCRTFYDVLFPLNKCENLKFDSNSIASAIINGNIIGFLKDCHEIDSNSSFRYRVEFKTTDHIIEKSEFVKNLSRQLDELSSGSLKNSTSSYEVEIRIIEKNNLCTVFLKLYTFKDTRFDYRENALPTSINPISAAIVLKSIEKWVKPNSSVLDPFCGAGTMLIERAKLADYHSLTGVDIYKTAISAATANTALASINVELVNKDILGYDSLEYFDELITNMPFDNKSADHNKYAQLYSDFIKEIPYFVKPGGMAFIHTIEKKLFKELLINNEELELIEEIKLEAGKLIPHVFVLLVK